MRRWTVFHCPTCKSRSEIDTDWNGHLVETLNHECTCPLPVSTTEKPGTCEDCGAPCHPNAITCAECAYLKSQERRNAAYRAQMARPKEGESGVRSLPFELVGQR